MDIGVWDLVYFFIFGRLRQKWAFESVIVVYTFLSYKNCRSGYTHRLASLEDAADYALRDHESSVFPGG